jgi:hypothetical protein
MEAVGAGGGGGGAAGVGAGFFPHPAMKSRTARVDTAKYDFDCALTFTSSSVRVVSQMLNWSRLKIVRLLLV